MLNAARAQAGLTLVELMIAGLIALIALSALLSVYATTARHSLLQLESMHLHQQLHTLLDVLARDLRRAGYRAFHPLQHAPAHNPFQNRLNRLRTGALGQEPNDSCVLFAYDLDKDALVGVGRACNARGCAVGSDADNVEQLGYRLNRQRLQSRYGGTTFGCDSGHWQTLNDPGIDITALRFELHRHCTNLADQHANCQPALPALYRRSLRIEISAEIHNKPQTRTQLGTWLRIPNDRLVPARKSP